MQLNFTVHGEPQAQKRHRHVTTGKFVRTYDPSAKDKEEFLKKCIQHKPEVPFEGALSMHIVFIFSRPLAHYGTGKNKGVMKVHAPIFHSKKPDVDNTGKFHMDALNGVFYKDDSQICSLFMAKLYVDSYTDKPRTEILITELEK